MKHSKDNHVLPQEATHSAKEKLDPTNISVIDFSKDYFVQAESDNFDVCMPFLQSDHNTWIHVTGHPSHTLLDRIGKEFKLHPLLLEDIHTEQRAKLEPYDNVAYIVLRGLYYNKEKRLIENEQISIILGPKFMISFEEHERPLKNELAKRILNRREKTKYLGCDWLLYAMSDVIVDNYFVILGQLGKRVDYLEEELMHSSNNSALHNVYLLKRQIIVMRKNIWPLREVVSKLNKEELEWVSPNITLYLRDLYDHTIQVIDTLETFRDMTSSVMDLYLTTISQKTNEIMKILAIAAAVFAPLTFLTGLWGMNFKFMPELSETWGYPAAIGLMLLIVIALVVFFKRKKWI